MDSITFDDYLATIQQRREQALQAFKPEYRPATEIEQELALRAALDYTNAELFNQGKLAKMLEYQLDQLNHYAEQSAIAIVQSSC